MWLVATCWMQLNGTERTRLCVRWSRRPRVEGTSWIHRLALLVFVRLGELVGGVGRYVDLEGAEWRYTVKKTGRPHVVRLARQAVAILREGSSHDGASPLRLPVANAFDPAFQRKQAGGDRPRGCGMAARRFRGIANGVGDDPEHFVERPGDEEGRAT